MGNSITVRGLNPNTGQMMVPPLRHTKTSSTIPYEFAGLITEGDVGTDSYKITADNFVLIGTKP